MIRISQIKIDVLNDNEINLKKVILKKLKINEKELIEYKIVKKSIDARCKEKILFVYVLDIKTTKDNYLLKKYKNLKKAPDEKYIYKNCGRKKLSNPPVIIGSGPAGLFCAYILAKCGYNPLIIERGEKIEKRQKTVDKFFETGILNLSSNVQFGEGGAGTFSDGKLNTQIKDPNFRIQKVLDTFIEMGASKEIKYIHNPHIGTDKLRNIIINLRKEIIKLGGTFKFESFMQDINITDKKLESIIVNNQKINCDVLVLAIGHSARDTFKLLENKEISMSAKPFAVGVRIQHLQEDININQYGLKYKDALPNASYKLTHMCQNKRGVYSFCMCPGGYVVNSSSEKNALCINGMSYHKRDSLNSNSAIVVTVFPSDYDFDYNKAIEFQRNLEKKAYKLGNGKIPVQLYKDFKNNNISHEFGKVKPLFKGNYTFENIKEIFPKFINDSLEEAIENFSKKIKNFNGDDAILSAVESRTSSPVRINRNEDGLCNINGIYPCGEGAGYAGGIMSAAVDGIKIAEKIIEKYQKKC